MLYRQNILFLVSYERESLRTLKSTQTIPHFPYTIMKKNHDEISLTKGFLLSADQISDRFLLTVVSAKLTFIQGDQRIHWVVSHITPKTEWFHLYKSKERH